MSKWIHSKKHHRFEMMHAQTETDAFTKKHAILNRKLTFKNGQFLLKGDVEGFPKQLDSPHLGS